MKILNKTIEVFYTEEELSNEIEKKHRNELEKQGYKLKEHLSANVDGIKGSIYYYGIFIEAKVY